MEEKKKEKLIKRIEEVGREFYQKKILVEALQKAAASKEKLLEDKIAALKLFLSCAFMRGRDDALSLRYLDCAHSIIDSNQNLIFENPGKVIIERSGRKIIGWNINSGNRENKEENKDKTNKSFLEAYVEEVNREGIKINPADLILLESVGKMLSDPSFNIIKFTVDNLAEGKAKEAYSYLSKPMIKDKIVSLFLRDCTAIFELKPKNKEEFYYLLPVDTWLEKIGEKIWSTKNHKQLKTKMIEETTSPILFNQGAWFVGKYSFELLLEEFQK